MKVELILKSFDELTKRKVKRNASVWMKKITDLQSIIDDIKVKEIPTICKFLLMNDLQLQLKSQQVLKTLIPLALRYNSFDLMESSILSITYTTLNEDMSSLRILNNNRDNFNIDEVNDEILLQFVKAISLLLSRKCIENDELYDNLLNISYKVLYKLWDMIKNFNNNPSISYLNSCELLIEYIFISKLLNVNHEEIKMLLNHHLITYSSIISKVKISQLLSQDIKTELLKQINHAKYHEILYNLKYYYFYKLDNLEFIQELFSRLCNTTGSSTFMCRQEARLILDYILQLLSRGMKESNDSSNVSHLYEYLTNIKRSNILDRSHHSNLRWNYPSLIV